VSSESASSEQIAGELRVGSSVFIQPSDSCLGQQHTKVHYHQFCEQKLLVSRNYERAKLVIIIIIIENSGRRILGPLCPDVGG